MLGNVLQLAPFAIYNHTQMWLVFENRVNFLLRFLFSAFLQEIDFEPFEACTFQEPCDSDPGNIVAFGYGDAFQIGACGNDTHHIIVIIQHMNKSDVESF